jgi:type IV pilus assembly protein PilW
MTSARVMTRRSRRMQAGHLLLEWIVATALGLLVLSGALALYRSQRDLFARSADAAAMREAGATALTIIGQQIQMAGFAPVDAPQLRAQLRRGVFGCEAPQRVVGIAPDEFACTSNSSSSLARGSDEIMVRYADDGVATWRSAAGEPTDCLGQGVDRQGAYAVIVNRFYVMQPKRRDEPELFCAGNGHATPQPLVEGIERLVIRYWLRGGIEPVSAREIAPMQWADMTAVDVCVVVRGQRARAATGFVDCDGNPAASSDGRARLSLWRHIVLRNHEAAL